MLQLAQRGSASNALQTSTERHTPLTWVFADRGSSRMVSPGEESHSSRASMQRKRRNARAGSSKTGDLGAESSTDFPSPCKSEGSDCEWPLPHALPKANHMCFLPEISFGISFDSFENCGNHT